MHVGAVGGGTTGEMSASTPGDSAPLLSRVLFADAPASRTLQRYHVLGQNSACAALSLDLSCHSTGHLLSLSRSTALLTRNARGSRVSMEHRYRCCRPRPLSLSAIRGMLVGILQYISRPNRAVTSFSLLFFILSHVLPPPAVLRCRSGMLNTPTAGLLLYGRRLPPRCRRVLLDHRTGG